MQEHVHSGDHGRLSLAQHLFRLLGLHCHADCDIDKRNAMQLLLRSGFVRHDHSLAIVLLDARHRIANHFA